MEGGKYRRSSSFMISPLPEGYSRYNNVLYNTNQTLPAFLNALPGRKIELHKRIHKRYPHLHELSRKDIEGIETILEQPGTLLEQNKRINT